MEYCQMYGNMMFYLPSGRDGILPIAWKHDVLFTIWTWWNIANCMETWCFIYRLDVMEYCQLHGNMMFYLPSGRDGIFPIVWKHDVLYTIWTWWNIANCMETWCFIYRLDVMEYCQLHGNMMFYLPSGRDGILPMAWKHDVLFTIWTWWNIANCMETWCFIYHLDVMEYCQLHGNMMFYLPSGRDGILPIAWKHDVLFTVWTWWNIANCMETWCFSYRLDVMEYCQLLGNMIFYLPSGRDGILPIAWKHDVLFTVWTWWNIANCMGTWCVIYRLDVMEYCQLHGNMMFYLPSGRDGILPIAWKHDVLVTVWTWWNIANCLETWYFIYHLDVMEYCQLHGNMIFYLPSGRDGILPIAWKHDVLFTVWTWWNIANCMETWCFSYHLDVMEYCQLHGNMMFYLPSGRDGILPIAWKHDVLVTVWTWWNIANCLETWYFIYHLDVMEYCQLHGNMIFYLPSGRDGILPIAWKHDVLFTVWTWWNIANCMETWCFSYHLDVMEYCQLHGNMMFYLPSGRDGILPIAWKHDVLVTVWTWWNIANCLETWYFIYHLDVMEYCQLHGNMIFYLPSGRDGILPIAWKHDVLVTVWTWWNIANCLETWYFIYHLDVMEYCQLHGNMIFYLPSGRDGILPIAWKHDVLVTVWTWWNIANCLETWYFIYHLDVMEYCQLHGNMIFYLPSGRDGILPIAWKHDVLFTVWTWWNIANCMETWCFSYRLDVMEYCQLLGNMIFYLPSGRDGILPIAWKHDILFTIWTWWNIANCMETWCFSYRLDVMEYCQLLGNMIFYLPSGRDGILPIAWKHDILFTIWTWWNIANCMETWCFIYRLDMMEYCQLHGNMMF